MCRYFHILLTTLLFGTVACHPNNDPSKQLPSVIATTTMLGDLATQIGGDSILAHAIMKPGGDPHLYQPTPRDAINISTSDVVITSGLHLEGWVDDLVRNAGERKGKNKRPIVVASTGVDAIKMENSPGGVDPHFWFDLQAWKIAARNVAEGIKPETPAVFHPRIDKNLEAYLAEVDATDAWVRKELSSIPESQRVLVTSHDAFHYFGRAYGVEVVAIQGVSTEQEASDRDVVNVIETIKKRNIPAVFVESSVNPALIKQVAKETGVKVAGPLYSDSIGTADSPASTFLGTVRENTRMITEALGGKHVAFTMNTDEAAQ